MYYLNFVITVTNLIESWIDEFYFIMVNVL